MNEKELLQTLLYDVERLKNTVGISDDDWKSPAKALKSMGIDMSVDWLRGILQRADYADTVKYQDEAGKSCSLIKGEHFTIVGTSWLVNAAKVKPILLSGALVLPELPTNYVS